MFLDLIVESQKIIDSVPAENKSMIIPIVAAILLSKFQNINIYIFSIFILAIGNAFLHVCGAIAVAAVSKKKIFPSSLFVAGGTFGIIIGRSLANKKVNIYYLFISILIIVLISLFTAKRWCKSEVEYIDVDIVN